MINPSANGWIDKLLLKRKSSPEEILSNDVFYQNVRKTGFLYGHVIGFDGIPEKEAKGWLKDEISKVALLNTLFGMYQLSRKNADSQTFLNDAASFYSHMHPQGFKLFGKVFLKGSPSRQLEQIINERVQTNQDIISKNFSHIVTNAMLFIDVLAFQQYLIHGSVSDKYFKRIEESIISILTLALKTKSVKSHHDDLLIKLFEASVRFSKLSNVGVKNPEALKLEYFTNDLEKYYFIDLAGIALWSDGIIERDEAYFLYKLGELMKLPDEFIVESMRETNQFIVNHKSDIAYFNYSNPVKHFYDHITENVKVLISRNKNRLLKEITESKELMVLLAHSTGRDLDAKEKKKVKRQLLDICKTIPSLTIFLLPGGSLLLPILIKFIPQMLPSVFNENNELE